MSWTGTFRITDQHLASPVSWTSTCSRVLGRTSRALDEDLPDHGLAPRVCWAGISRVLDWNLPCAGLGPAPVSWTRTSGSHCSASVPTWCGRSVGMEFVSSCHVTCPVRVPRQKPT